jgi:O-antigen/teichoic acid export membrane protein
VVNESLITLPYVVFTHQLEGEERARYAGSVLVHQFAWAHLAALGLALTAMIVNLSPAPEHRDLAPVLAILADCVLLVLIREFARRVTYAHLQLGVALILDLAVTLLQLLALLGLARAGLLNARTAHGVIGLVCILVAGPWLFLERKTFHVRWGRVLEDWKRGWNLGSWEAGSRVVEIARGYSVHWLLLLVLGKAATGQFAAILTVIFLSNPFIMGIGNLLVPQAARAVAEGGRHELGRVVIRMLGLTVVVMGGFTLVLVVFGVRLVGLLTKGDYSDYPVVIALLALTQFVFALMMLIYQGLTALEETRFNFAVSIFTLLLTVGASGGALLLGWGISGASWGYLIGMLAGLLIRSVYFIRLTRVRDADESAALA